MEPILLRTKFNVPLHRAIDVPRANLLARLNQALEPGYRLVLVSAPAGYGKTTLIGTWLHLLSGIECTIQTAAIISWLTLDEADNDPVRFLRYLVAALQSADPSLGRSITPLLEGFLRPDFSLEPVLLALINELAAQPGFILVVLDDLHTLQSSDVYRLLGFLVDHQPDNVRLLITTRTDPPLPLPRMRARRQLIELRMADLCFTEEEAAAFLTENVGISLGRDQVAVLMRRTEGWVTGLQLAGAAIQSISRLQGSSIIPQFIDSMGGSDRYILEYLLDEVLSHQPEAIQQFLLASCILTTIHGDLCDTILDRSDSTTLLEELERANLFIVPIDPSRTWYRYHPLFAEFLRTRRHPAVDRRLLHSRAANWFESHGLVDEALKHAFQARDFEHLAHLVERFRRQMLVPGEAGLLVGYLDALPEEIRATRPLLLLAQAWADLLAGHTLEIEARIQAAFNTSQLDSVAVLGEAAAIRALAAILAGNFSRAASEASQALGHLPPDDCFLRAWLNLDMGMASDVLGDLPKAMLAFQDALADGHKLGNRGITALAFNELGDIHYRLGNLPLAAEMYRQSIDAASYEGKPSPPAAVPYSRLGRLYYEWNDLGQAKEHLQRAVELGQYWEGEDISLYAQAYLAHISQSEGNLEGAALHARAAEKSAEGAILSTPTLRIVRAFLARLALRQGNLPAAQVWEQQLPAPSPDTPSLISEVEESTRARVLLTNGNASAALACLGGILSLAELEQRHGSLVELLALQAQLFAALNQPAEARATLRRSLAFGETGGYLRTFADEGQPMLALIESSAVHTAISRKYQNSLRQAFGQETRLVTPGVIQVDGLAEPLSQREMEVLRLISDGCSNQEIARRMVVSVSTVKTHINNLYGKLGAQTRTEALVRARKINLLGE